MFEPGHMNFDADRDDPNFNTWAEPSIANMTEKAIKILEKHENGYFLMVEGEREIIWLIHHSIATLRPEQKYDDTTL